MTKIEFTVTNENVNAIPSNVTHLTFGDSFNQPLSVGVIPECLTYLSFGKYIDSKFNQPLSVGVIPNSVTHLTFGMEFNQPLSIGIIPNSVTHLTFIWDFNQPLSVGAIPNSVTHLTFESHFNQPLAVGAIPNSVIDLKFGENFNQPITVPTHLIDTLPKTIQDLIVYNFESLVTKEIETVEDCSICLESTSSIITDCKHQYCTSCIQTWLRINRSCPCCRKNLCNTNLFLIKNE